MNNLETIMGILEENKIDFKTEIIGGCTYVSIGYTPFDDSEWCCELEFNKDGVLIDVLPE